MSSEAELVSYTWMIHFIYITHIVYYKVSKTSVLLKLLLCIYSIFLLSVRGAVIFCLSLQDRLVA